MNNQMPPVYAALRISDLSIEPPKVLVRFSALVSAILEVCPHCLDGLWRVQNSDGYGKKLTDLWNVAKQRDVIIGKDQLLDLAYDDTIEIYWLDLISLTMEAPVRRLGIFDSTFLYVVGLPEYLNLIADKFQHVEVVPPDGVA